MQEWGNVCKRRLQRKRDTGLQDVKTKNLEDMYNEPNISKKEKQRIKTEQKARKKDIVQIRKNVRVNTSVVHVRVLRISIKEGEQEDKEIKGEKKEIREGHLEKIPENKLHNERR